MKKVVYTIVDDRYYYPVGTHIFVNSFRKFHPDINLVVFRQDKIDEVFNKEGINFYQAKPFFAKLLTDKYDLVVNIDADTVVTGRLTEVFDNVDYDIVSVSNLNDYENASLEDITPEMYLQAGMVGSTKVEFWDKWCEMNRDAMKYIRQENDVLNLLVYHELKHLKLKIADKDKDYYGCKSLNRESEFYIKNDELMCRGEYVKSYHWAKGQDMPKLEFSRMGVSFEVEEWLTRLGYYGITETYASI